MLSQLVLACGDVSLVNFVRLSGDAIAAAREALSNGCRIVGDVPAVTATLDRIPIFCESPDLNRLELPLLK